MLGQTDRQDTKMSGKGSKRDDDRDNRKGRKREGGGHDRLSSGLNSTGLKLKKVRQEGRKDGKRREGRRKG